MKSFLDLLEKQLQKTDVLKKQLKAAENKIKDNKHPPESHMLYLSEAGVDILKSGL